MTDQTVEDKSLPKGDKDNKIVLTTLLVGIFIVAISPILFTQFSWIDFTKTGSIGDTIGGITAPIVNLIGAILIYYSFRQQMNANEIQIKSLKNEKQDNKDNQIVSIINNLTKICLDKIDKYEISIYHKSLLTEFNGIIGIEYFFKLHIDYEENSEDYHIPERYINSISQLNSNISLLLFHIGKITSKDLKEIYLNLYYHQIHIIVYSKVLDLTFQPNELNTSKYYDTWAEVVKNVRDYDNIKKQFSE